jgi:hypothetical protein
MDVQPATLTFAADPGDPKRDMTSGVVVIHVATNAAHGFVLRLLSNDMRPATGLAAVLHLPRLHLAHPDGSARTDVDVGQLGSQGLVLADSPDPVPDRQALEFRLLLTTDVDFTTSPESYIANLRFSFEPRY